MINPLNIVKDIQTAKMAVKTGKMVERKAAPVVKRVVRKVAPVVRRVEKRVGRQIKKFFSFL